MKFKEEDLQKVKELKVLAAAVLFGEGEDIIDMFRLYEEKAPGMWLDWMAGGFLKFMEESTIDPKTRELILIGILAAVRCPGGVLFHTMAALNEGVPEEHIMDVLQLVAYEGAKVPLVEAASMIKEGISRYQKALKEGKIKANQ